MNNTIQHLWLEAKGFPWWSHYDVASGRLPKRCYLCGKEDDWLLGLRKLIPIYGKVKKHSFSNGSSNWIWWSTETCLTDLAKDEQDRIREICAKPGCWFEYKIELTNIKTGEKITVPACSSRRIMRLLRDLIIDSTIYGYATMRFVGLNIHWVINWLKWKIYQVVGGKNV